MNTTIERTAGAGLAAAKGSDAELLWRIQNYLALGGLFNPEAMEHDKVRRLLIDCRTEFDAAIADSAIKSAIAQADGGEG